MRGDSCERGGGGGDCAHGDGELWKYIVKERSRHSR